MNIIIHIIIARRRRRRQTNGRRCEMQPPNGYLMKKIELFWRVVGRAGLVSRILIHMIVSVMFWWWTDAG